MAGAFTLEGFESPEEVQARIGKAEQAAFRPQGDINSMIYQTAAQGAAGMGGALAQLAGYEDPAVKKARGIQEMMKDLDPTTSAGLYEGSKRLLNAGYTKEASAISDKALQVRKVEASETPDAPKYNTTRINRDGIEETWITKGGIPLKRIAESKIKGDGNISVNFGDKESIKYSFNQLKDASLDAKVADNTLANLDKMEALIGNVNTGTLTNMKVSLSQLGTSLGIDVPKDIANLEAANAVAGDLVMGVLSKFKGAISDAERRFAADIMPKLSQTKEGRAQIVVYLRAIAKRAKTKKNMMTKFIQTHGKQLIPDEGETFDDQWTRHVADNPLFPEPTKSKTGWSIKRAGS